MHFLKGNIGSGDKTMQYNIELLIARLAALQEVDKVIPRK